MIGSTVYLFSPFQVQEQHKNGTRIKLDVSLKAPQIVVPLRSDSREVILADLGQLTLSNSFYHPPSEKTAFVEEFDIQLADLKVVRYVLRCYGEYHGNYKLHFCLRTVADYLSSDGKDVPCTSILVPFNLSLAVQRNLSASWYRDVPTIDLAAELQTLKVFNLVYSETCRPPLYKATWSCPIGLYH